MRDHHVAIYGCAVEPKPLKQCFHLASALAVVVNSRETCRNEYCFSAIDFSLRQSRIDRFLKRGLDDVCSNQKVIRRAAFTAAERAAFATYHPTARSAAAAIYREDCFHRLQDLSWRLSQS